MGRCFLIILSCCVFTTAFSAEKIIIRVGHYPNISHAQGMVGHHFSREKKGWFEKRLGPNVEIQWYVFDAGPAVMEAIFADSLDLTYVGPSPTINAYVRSKGTEIRIVSGACSGGSGLVVHKGGNMNKPADFLGKKVATPSFGNTQDIAARAWLSSKGFKVKQNGGDVTVIPTQPADQLALFKKGDIDAVWAIEPWMSRLIMEANGTLFLNESSLWPETNGRYVTTHLVSSKKFLQNHPDILKKWILAHVELTDWINSNPNEAKAMFMQEFTAETKIAVSKLLVDKAWKNLEFTIDPISLSLFKNAKEAQKLGFIKGEVKLDGVYSLKLLNEVLIGKGKVIIK